MKKMSKILLILATMFFASSTFAQNRTITEKDVNVLRDKAVAALNKLSHREKMITQEFEDKKKQVAQTYSFTKEFSPPDRSHFVFQSETARETQGSESIHLADRSYSKLKNEVWKLDASAGRESGADTILDADNNSDAVPHQTVSVIHRQNEMIGNVSTDFYEIKRIQKFQNENKFNENMYVSRYWFNKDGMILKAERESTSTNSKSLYRRTSIYEYDPTIKIEPPIN